MSNIRFFALGGLGENGKNFYVVDVDHKYYILDSGIKFPSSDNFGVDEIVSDFSQLAKFRQHIQGIFLSHAHDDHIGAIPYLLKEINVPVYGTKFTLLIVKDMLKEHGMNEKDFKFEEVDSNSTILFGKVKVSFFQTTHSIPESIGIVINTLSGSIVYTSDFTLNQTSDPAYQTDFQKISEIADKKVLALLVESQGTMTNTTSGSDDRLTHQINSIFTNLEGRILVSLYSSDLKKIQTVIDMAVKHNRKIAIIGRRAQRMVDLAIANGYLNIPKKNLVILKYITDANKNDDKNLVCLITGNRHEPFYMLQRICKKQDQLINISKDDTVIMLTQPVSGTEKMAARTLDILYRSDANVHQIQGSDLGSNHASSDEVRLMISLFRPEFVIPVIGEFRHQYQTKRIAMDLGYDEEKIILLNNGDSFNYPSDGKFYISKANFKADELFIDGSTVGDVNQVVIHDREMLSDDGVLLVIGHVNPRKKEIVGEPIIETRGFIYVKESENIIDGIKDVFHKVSAEVLKGKYIKWQDYKRDLRNAIINYVYTQTKRRPIVIPVIVSVDK